MRHGKAHASFHRNFLSECETSRQIQIDKPTQHISYSVSHIGPQPLLYVEATNNSNI